MTEEKQQTKTTEPTTEPSELEVCKKQAEEYLNNWKRERADFINYKKDEAKRLEEFVKFANEEIILEAIELVDDLEEAVKHDKDGGLKQIMVKFTNWLKKYGVEKIPVVGEKFNPELHEAVGVKAGRIPASGEWGEGMIEVRSGYLMRGKVIRPARVKTQINK